MDFLNLEMNPTDSLFWLQQELQQHSAWVTYHSFLGVPIDGQTALRNENTNNAQVRARLDGVEYIFWMKSLWLHVMIITRSALSLQGIK